MQTQSPLLQPCLNNKHGETTPRSGAFVNVTLYFAKMSHDEIRRQESGTGDESG
jgi:hypothetical protein